MAVLSKGIFVGDWCYCCSVQEGGDMFPRNENGDFIFSDVDFLETWEVSLEARSSELFSST